MFEVVVCHRYPDQATNWSTNSLTGVLVEPAGVHAKIENRALLPLGVAAREVALELLHQDRHAFLAAALVADRVLADDFLQLRAVLELRR